MSTGSNENEGGDKRVSGGENVFVYVAPLNHTVGLALSKPKRLTNEESRLIFRQNKPRKWKKWRAENSKSRKERIERMLQAHHKSVERAREIEKERAKQRKSERKDYSGMVPSLVLPLDAAGVANSLTSRLTSSTTSDQQSSHTARF